MYDSYKGGYSQEYDTYYPQEPEGDNSIYCDAYNTDSPMIMNQPRNNNGSLQFRNPNYQNYMGYPINQSHMPIVPHSYTKNFIYSQQRSMHPRTQHYPSQYIGMSRQAQMGSYQPQQTNGNYVSREVHEKMIKKYENALRMLKTQNMAVIEKLKFLNRKIYQQQKIVKDYIFSGSTSNEISESHSIETFKKFNSQQQQNYIFEEQQPTQSEYDNFDPNLQKFKTETNENLNYESLNQPQRKQPQRNINPNVQRILAQKIKRMAEKANDKVKTENIQKPIESLQTPTGQKPLQDSTKIDEAKLKKGASQISAKKPQIQQHYEDQDNLDPEQPMYPDDHEGEQSFLVDEEVQEKQRLKSLKKNSKAGTFGILNPELNDFSYRSACKNPEIQKECQIIEKCFDNFLCPQIIYAPKKEFFKHRINKTQLFEIYIWWRENNIKSINSNLDKKTIQCKITNEIHKRYPSLKDQRQSFAGIKFKDHQIIKMMKTPKILTI